MTGTTASAQAPKAPVLKPPALKAPELKAPELKAPELKVPEAKAPAVKVPEGKASGLKPPEAKAPEGLVSEGEAQVPAGSTELPPELTGITAGTSGVAIEEIGDDAPLTIKDIVNSAVTTASNRPETALDAPAWIITLTADDMKARGYQELTDLLDDLPGMDVIRSWGSPYFQSYWRGYHKHEDGDFFVQGEDPFLLMVDGMPFNHLGLGQTQIMAAIPLSNVAQVEVVYGPASALYGPNASMGVINVITRRDDEQNGLGTRAQVSVRSPQRSLTRLGDMTKVADFSALYKGPGFRVSLSGRFDFGVLDTSLGERFEWLKSAYYKDYHFWDAVSDAQAFPLAFRSPNEKQALDARFILEKHNDEGKLTGETEVSAQMYRMLTGRGLAFPADFIHTSSPYALLEQSLSLRHWQNLSSSLRSTTLLRYRRSNVDNPTALLLNVEPLPDAMSSGYFVYLQNANTSLGVSQGFTLDAGTELLLEQDALLLDFGFQYERRDLGREYDQSWGGWGPDDDGDIFPTPIEATDRVEQRNKVDVAGMYLLSKYTLLEGHALHLGLRLDYNTNFGTIQPSFRGGYVGQFFNALTVKLFLGQAIAEPSTRNLRPPSSPGSPGSGDSEDDPEAQLTNKPERSQTVEAGLDYKLSWLVLHGTAYYVHYDGVESSFDTDPPTSAPYEGRVAGVDVGATALVPLSGIRQLRVWGYYSPYLLAQQTIAQAPGSWVKTGDLARHKLLLGATLEVNRALSVTGLGRCMSQRETVLTNPLEKIPAYCVLDANLLVRDFFVEGLSVALRVSNVLDTLYSHPGLYSASSGNFPGRWEKTEDGVRWIGSGSGSGIFLPFNSQLPQPGRAFTLQLGLEL